MATKRIKLIKPWQVHPAGAEVDFPVPIADLLIERGRAEAIGAEEGAEDNKKPNSEQDGPKDESSAPDGADGAKDAKDAKAPKEPKVQKAQARDKEKKDK
jgi:hypothetical protein